MTAETSAPLKLIDWLSREIFTSCKITGTWRESVFELFQKKGLPHRKQDMWKYVNVQNLLANSYKYIPNSTSLISNNASDFSAEQVNIKLQDFTRPPLEELDKQTNSFALLNYIAATKQLEINITSDIIDRALFIDFNTLSAAMCFHKVKLNIAESVMAYICIYSSAQEDLSYLNYSIDINLAANAQVHLLNNCNSSGAETYCTARQVVNLAAGANFSTYFLAGNYDFLLHDTLVRLMGAGAEFNLGGLGLVSNEEHQHIHTTVEHLASHTSSRQDYKNILFRSAQTEFFGLIENIKDAFETSSHMHNSNLMLSNLAQASSRPQLKLFNENINCTHGSSSANLNDNELYYLQNRGLDLASSRLLLMQSFLRGLVEKIPKRLVLRQEASQLEDLLAKNSALI